MSIRTVYPTSVAQASESNTNYREFNNLSNVKNNKSTYAKSKSAVASKTGTHKKPSSIIAMNFKANIPVGSNITKITVEYAANYEGNLNIGKPSLDILNVNGSNKNGKFLTKTMSKSSVTWTGSFKVTDVNNYAFGVKINFPANTSTITGYVKIQYIRIIITYTAPNYSIAASKVSGVYTDDDFKLQLKISNVNKTSNDSNVTINLPAGVTYTGKDSGDGSITQAGSTLTWKPGLTGKVLNRSILLNMKISTDGNHNITISESGSNHSTNVNLYTTTNPNYDADYLEAPNTQSVDNSKSQPNSIEVIQVEVNEEFSLDLSFDDYSGSQVKIYACIVGENSFDADSNYCTENILIFSQSRGQWAWRKVTINDNQYVSPLNYDLTNLMMQNNFKCTVPGEYVIAIYDSSNTSLLKKINLSVRPSENDLTTPFLSILKIDGEELSRMGDGIVYTAQSWLKVMSNGMYVHDWVKNFRIGVMNNINPNVDTSTEISEVETVDGDELTIEPVESEIVDPTAYENLTSEQIFEYAEYWSECPSDIDVFESLTVEFPYNQKYPVYIICTGDYPEGDPNNNNVQFTEPCIVESKVFSGYEQPGNFPVPLNNTIVDVDLSVLDLKLFEKGNSFIIYDFPLEEGYSSSDDFAVTGIELTGDVEFSDQLVLSAKLCNSEGDLKHVGERSIIIGDVDAEDETVEGFSIGGKYDLWGFKISDIQNLDKWWIELSLNNRFSNTDNNAEIHFKNLQLTIYSNQAKSNVINIKVEGELVRHYGMFVQKAKVPEGLATDVKYITIDGTDTNDAYRMNIKGKEIEIEFRVRGCDLTETTEQLHQLAKLFVNERDELNRPIPKRLELSNYPDVYFLYIMEDPFDSDPEIADYTSKVKLTIPAGTAFAKEDTVSNINGVNKGIAKVKPIITFIPTGDNVELTETVNNQKFKITYSEWSANNTVEIDCINQKITILDWINPDTGLPEEKDITQEGDFNNDWFILNNEYVFKEDNCIIQTVSFTERW